MSESGASRKPHDEFSHRAERRISIRAAYLRREVEREAQALSDKFRLVLALEEIGARLQAGEKIAGADSEWFDLAIGVSSVSMASAAHCADWQLRREGRDPDALLPDAPLPDEARVLQVLLRLQEIPRLEGGRVTEILRRALSVANPPKWMGPK